MCVAAPLRRGCQFPPVRRPQHETFRASRPGQFVTTGFGAANVDTEPPFCVCVGKPSHG